MSTYPLGVPMPMVRRRYAPITRFRDEFELDAETYKIPHSLKAYQLIAKLCDTAELYGGQIGFGHWLIASYKLAVEKRNMFVRDQVAAEFELLQVCGNKGLEFFRVYLKALQDEIERKVCRPCPGFCRWLARACKNFERPRPTSWDLLLIYHYRRE